MKFLIFLVAIWLTLGLWLAIDLLVRAIPRAKASGEKISWFGVIFAFLVVWLFSPALFIRAFMRTRGKRNG